MTKVFKTLIVSDILILSGFSFISPIFALFITNNIEGGNVKVVGFAAAFHLIIRAFLQLPVARYLDRLKGEWDEFFAMVTGAFIITIIPFLYLFIKTVPQLYLIQIIYSFGFALNFPGWVSLFVRYIEKEKESFNASLYSTLVILATGITSALGGTIVDRYGFNLLFIIVGLFSFFGSLTLLYLRYPNKLLKK